MQDDKRFTDEELEIVELPKREAMFLFNHIHIHVHNLFKI